MTRFLVSLILGVIAGAVSSSWVYPVYGFLGVGVVIGVVFVLCIIVSLGGGEGIIDAITDIDFGD